MRPYHSASSIKLGQRCPRAWAYCYLDGLRDPEVAWSDVTPTTPPRLRSFALGKAVHAVFERYYCGEPADWASLPGQIAASGVGNLPPRDACRAEVEQPIGRESRTGAPAGRVLRVHGVAWAGFRDLLIDETLQVDYKTTASIAKYALTPDRLRADVQCALYTVDACERFGVDAFDSRWLYLETKRIRRAWPVDVVVTHDEALAALAPAAELAKRLDTIASSADAPQNLDACADYGGCQYHVTQGGPCDARRSLSAYFAQEKAKMTQPVPGLDPAKIAEMSAKFGAVPVPPPPPPPPAAPAPVAPLAAPAPALPVAAPPPPATAAATPAPAVGSGRRGRKTDAAPVAVAPMPAMPTEGLGAALAAAAADVAAAEAALDAAIARARALLGGAA